MRMWIVVPVGIALLTAACGETRMQRTATGAGTGALAGAFAGPVGALVGAGVGGAAGAYRDTVDETVDRQTENVAEAIDEARDGDDVAEAPQPETAVPEQSAAGAPEGTGFDQRAAVTMESDLTNEEVREAQTTLSELGLYEGEIDGLYGRRTMAAVGEFQAQQGLPRTSMLTESTKQQLQEAQSAAATTGGSQAIPQEQTGEAPAETQAGGGAVTTDVPQQADAPQQNVPPVETEAVQPLPENQ